MARGALARVLDGVLTKTAEYGLRALFTTLSTHRTFPKTLIFGATGHQKTMDRPSENRVRQGVRQSEEKKKKTPEAGALRPPFCTVIRVKSRLRNCRVSAVLKTPPGGGEGVPHAETTEIFYPSETLLRFWASS